jgi:hypothetical protein
MPLPAPRGNSVRFREIEVEHFAGTLIEAKL